MLHDIRITWQFSFVDDGVIPKDGIFVLDFIGTDGKVRRLEALRQEIEISWHSDYVAIRQGLRVAMLEALFLASLEECSDNVTIARRAGGCGNA